MKMPTNLFRLLTLCAFSLLLASASHASEVFTGPYAICFSHAVDGREDMSANYYEVGMKRVGNRFYAFHTKSNPLFGSPKFTSVFEAVEKKDAGRVSYQNAAMKFNLFFYKDEYSGVPMAGVSNRDIEMLCEHVSENSFASDIDPRSKDNIDKAKVELLNFKP